MAHHPETETQKPGRLVSFSPRQITSARVLLSAVLFTLAISTEDVWTAVNASGDARESVAEIVRSTNLEDGAPCPTTPPTDWQCGDGPCVVDIKESAKAAINREPFDRLKAALERPNTTVRIGPNVELDFDGLGNDYFPLRVERCVTLMSVDSFGPAGAAPVLGRREPSGPNLKQKSSSQSSAAARQKPQARGSRRAQRRSRRNVAQRRTRRNVARRPTTSANSNVARAIIGEDVGPIDDLEVEQPTRIGSGRTPKSPGPLFKFGANHPGEVKTFFELRCDGGFTGDGVRISGFRLYGKSFGQQTSSEIAIQNLACVNFEISNMEIAGWAVAAIKIVDSDAEPPLGPGGRISRPDQVRIFGNYIHHNQHPHESGYGVAVNEGAWAHIYKNVFDHNRHAIKGDGRSGGYTANHNLVLKGGGIHGRFYNEYTHQFDIHGDKNCGITGLGGSAWNCGHAGFEVVYESNAFQYRKDNAIKIRGKPRTRGFFGNNIFPHEGFEDDRGDDAISLYSKTNIGFSGNKIDIDTFGSYGVCDFDADGVDDLFLATGATWWYSSFGEFPWSYLNAKQERLEAVRLGYFDNDLRCDVLTQRDGQLLYSSGGYGDWQALGKFDVPLSEVKFGRFDPAQTDFRPGATRRTTHAFWQRADSQWFVVSLVGMSPSTLPDWKAVASSGKKLQFGDFTGDGVTDVLAVVGGHWQISESAQQPWRDLNQELDDSVGQLKIANMDPDDNIDDILKLERKTKRMAAQNTRYEQTTLTWWRSKNGTDTWKKLKEYIFFFPISKAYVSPQFGYVGRFGLAPGGGTLVIGHDRRGLFYSEAETLAGGKPEFPSTFDY